ncbi:MAG: exopolysaccharide biosynthesis polyprenyl glycosylphosphotransferase family protein [Actinomycetia bacterium]|nr:exopolysaccharide biosynthesis polyprenyl glycosylphosphotransferase family protein [Actinomycetes bacterium]
MASMDGLCGLIAGPLALVLRFDTVSRPFVMPYVVASLALPFVWLVSMALAGTYEERFIGVGPDEFRRVANAGICLAAAVAIGAYSMKVEVARGYVVLAIPLTTALTLLSRYRLRKRLHRTRAQGRNLKRVVAVGHASVVEDLVHQLRRQAYHGFRVVAVCLPSVTEPDAQVAGLPVLGDFSSVAKVVDLMRADCVAVLACPEINGTALRRLAWELEEDAVDLIVAPALIDVAGPRTSIRPIAGLPLLHVEHPRLGGARHVVKSLYDRILAGLLLALSQPLLVAIALAIRLDSAGPVLFRQTRVGKNGVAFTVYKFRTMVQGAERQKAGLLEHNESDGTLFKIKNDPRITQIGAWLRRWSVDELPQLINVLRGEMSLVGPRPPLPQEVAEYGGDAHRRLVVKPGMTGLWQVSGRSDLSWEESVQLDLRYVENWSLLLDLQILWKTWNAVVFGKGAY